MSPRACSSGVTATSTRNTTLRPPVSMVTLESRRGPELVRRLLWPPLLQPARAPSATSTEDATEADSDVRAPRRHGIIEP